MKRTLKLFCLFMVVHATSFAQKQGRQLIDSFLAELPKAQEDTSKAFMLGKIGFHYHLINPDSGIMYGQLAYSLSESLGWKKGMAIADNAIGTNVRIKADYSKALEYFFEALKINEEIGEKRSMAQNYGNIGIVYKTQKDYTQALENYQKALSMFEAIGDKDGIGTNLGNIGIIYESLHDYPKSLEYQNKALKVYEAMGNKKSIAHNLGNIGLVYDGMHDYTTALDYEFKALAINEELGNKKSIGNNCRSIGTVYYHMDSSGVVGARDNGIRYLEKGIKVSMEIGDKRNLQDMYELLSQFYFMSGNHKDALANYRKYVAYKDSIFTEKNTEKIQGLITERELSIRDKEIELDKLAVAKKRNERVFYITGMALLLLTVLFILRNYVAQKRSNVLLEKEKRKSDDLLLNILPVEVAEELKAKGSAEARYFDDVTILFTDFVNFTEASERINSRELIHELDTCFKAFDGIIYKHGIEKIKTIGDAYLAVCGLPVKVEEHAERIIRAALEIQAFMVERRKQMGDNTFELRVGIHSGSVVAGIVGVKKFAYDIWGDTVNTAARMEQHSEAGKINISQTTYELVGTKFNCVYRGEIEVKNKGVLKMYFVEA